MGKAWRQCVTGSRAFFSFLSNMLLSSGRWQATYYNKICSPCSDLITLRATFIREQIERMSIIKEEASGNKGMVCHPVEEKESSSPMDRQDTIDCPSIEDSLWLIFPGRLMGYTKPPPLVRTGFQMSKGLLEAVHSYICFSSNLSVCLREQT